MDAGTVQSHKMRESRRFSEMRLECVNEPTESEMRDTWQVWKMYNEFQLKFTTLSLLLKSPPMLQLYINMNLPIFFFAVQLN